MSSEIHIEDIGIARIPNMWQYARIKKMAPGRNKVIAPYAASVGMSLQQFKKLPFEKQKEIEQAYFQLTAPPRIKAA